MKNIKVDEKDGKLILTIDLKEEGKPSSTGKMQLLANSGGWTQIETKTLKDKTCKINLTFGYVR